MNYTNKVMDYFINPRNMGEIENADGIGEVGNAKCGDIMKLYIKIDGDVIIDAKFQTFGCAAAIATSSILTELIIGKTINEALLVNNDDVVSALGGLPEVKIHCSLLAREALEEAVLDYGNKNGIEYNFERSHKDGHGEGCGCNLGE